MRRRLIAAVVALLAAAVLPAARPAAQSSDSFCNLQTTERIVAIGDVHGAYDRFAAILRAAGLTDQRDRWIGGKAVLVQTGDVVDRGADSRRALDLLRRLERDAARSGGRVYAVLGNHELMRLTGDWRYVSAGELKAFQNGNSEGLRQQVHDRVAEANEERARAEKKDFDAKAFREQFMKEVPLGFLEMRQAFDAGGDYGPWIRSRPAMIRLNGIVFMHGGVSTETAARGCDAVNAAVKGDMASLPLPPEKMASLSAAAEAGPLWYRGLATEREDAFAPTLEAILQKMEARAIVIGHTVAPRITPRFGGRVVQIDTGMLDGTFFPGGVASALEIQGNKFTAIYEDRREEVPTPNVR